ncbi:M48 family metallopeptidase [Pseudoxanthomonas dokdonensis]|uniref:YgjP-like metallopeptidase domain-containing protein n=1 Tax=Pseudoxanthomonas dokdonensis TaxID=344882 RepID=A0A0R0CQY4_9GAMM|nr:SprT family zinc-dependent metalloprotease [Pseudoxanthomonas dokdonensis]KRG68286.1 hypothetical protein ABB29_13225 [Pseudoxanthomonas dokdonensis]
MASRLPRLIAPPAAAVRDTLAVTLPDGSDASILRVRNPRAKRIKLSVDERGARLTLPMRASLAAGDQFLQQHLPWLAQQLLHYAQPLQVEALLPGQTASIPLRGQPCPVQWRSGRYLKMDLEDDGLVIQLPPRLGATALQRSLRGFYEAQARADIGRWLPRYLPELPRAPRQILFKVMSSQWGSLAPDGSMALDLSLVTARPSAFEYVLVHELCHLIHANHSPAYWAEVDRRFPDWREERQYFRDHGRQLKGSLRALLSA